MAPRQGHSVLSSQVQIGTQELGGLAPGRAPHAELGGDDRLGAAAEVILCIFCL